MAYKNKLIHHSFKIFTDQERKLAELTKEMNRDPERQTIATDSDALRRAIDESYDNHKARGGE